MGRKRARSVESLNSLETRSSKVQNNVLRIDRISHLPWPILDNILGKLSIKEAIRTSILSKEWRYKWINISKLDFDYDVVTALGDTDDASRLIMLIYSVLLSHSGGIHKFEISAYNERMEIMCYHLDTWIKFLAKNGVKELILACHPDELYKIPSCLFSCQQLTHLEMYKISLELPSDFKGFPNLVSLVLYKFFDNAEVLSSLICNCPVLQILDLKYFILSTCLTIRAPKLEYLSLDGFLSAILLDNCPSLENISMQLTTEEPRIRGHEKQNLTCNLLQDLSRLPRLKNLDISGPFLQNQHLWGPPEKLDGGSNHFDFLLLNQFSLTHPTEVTVAFNILKLLPNLKKFFIRVEFREQLQEPSELQKALCSSSCSFKQLRKMWMHIIPDPYEGRYLSSWHLELKFIKFMLARSPSLELLRIAYDEPFFECSKSFERELFSFDHASPLLKIDYSPLEVSRLLEALQSEEDNIASSRVSIILPSMRNLSLM